MDFSTFHWVVQSGKRWKQKWGSPGMHCLRDEYTVGVRGDKRRFLLAKINEAVAEAAEVWGAVQMLKEQQSAFQLVMGAGGSAGTNASLCENKQFIRCVVCEGFFMYILSIIWGSHFTSAQKSAPLFSSTKTARDFTLNWGFCAVKYFLLHSSALKKVCENVIQSSAYLFSFRAS